MFSYCNSEAKSKSSSKNVITLERTWVNPYRYPNPISYLNPKP